MLGFAVGTGALGVITGPSAGAQSNLGPLGQATVVTPPSNAGSPAGPHLSGVSCTSPGNCVAVGYYSSATSYEAMAATETGGTWAQATEVTPPSNAGSTPLAQLFGVSCTSPGNCTAVGFYADNSPPPTTAWQVMAVTETAGTWGQATEVTAPSNAASNFLAFLPVLNGVSCTSPGNCVAVGSYNDSSGAQQAMEVAETAGAWGQATEVTLSANAGSTGGAGLNSVSCISRGDCAATGSYRDSSNELLPMAATETGGTWAQATGVTVPSSAATGINPNAFFKGVSCTSPGNCLAVGSYFDNTPTGYAIEAIETDGTWGPATEVAGLGELFGVSCTSADSCVAVGDGGAGAMAASSLAPTSTTLSSSASSAYVGQPVTLTATVAPSSGTGTPTGTVAFSQGTTSLGTAPVNSSGQATLTTSALAPGADPVTASYSGDTTFGGSTSATLTQTVTGCPTGATAHLLTATTNAGTIYGLFCVNSTGFGSYQQGSAAGFAAVVVGANETAIIAIGPHLALLGSTTSSSSAIVELAPQQAIGTFVLG
jgi:hypothetical protein